MITPIMTLRQYYAAHAPFDLSDAYASMPPTEERKNRGALMDRLAELRFAYADAMIEAENE